MGVTIGTKSMSIDMGYAGFARLRTDVAGLICPELKELYKTLPGASFGEKELQEYNKKLGVLQEKNNIPDDALDFLYQSDCSGRITSACSKIILDYIGEYDSDIRYGYVGLKDCATFRDFKEILQCSVKTGSDVTWH